MRERRKKRCGSKTRTEYGVFGRSTGYAINGTRQTTIAYDTYGRISTMTIPTTENGENVHSPTPTQDSNSFQWSYLQGSDLKSSLTYPNGLTASWTYDANNQLLQVRNATQTNVISQFDYTYDASGRRVSIAKTGSAFGDLSGSIDSYTYNLRSELTSARRTKNGQPIPGFSEDFDYDPIGNRRSSTTYNEKSEAQTSTYEANNLNQYMSRTTPGYAAVRGEADPAATVTVNENLTFRLGSYYFGSDLFDNTTSSGFANLLTYATLAQTAANGEEADDLVSAMTNQVYIAQSPEPFAYDDDGNQTLVATKTGLWRVTYNGENRPILWVRDSDNTTLTMSYDHMGRRREKNAQRFFYDGYLQVYNSHSPTPLSTVALAEAETSNSNSYIWDCTENVATRPLVWFRADSAAYYVHDGNKNVSEVISSSGDLAAHYDYTPFGAEIAQRGVFAAANPWRFSSEFADDELGCDYYNYREYEPVAGRWIQRDVIEGSVLLEYSYTNNRIDCFDWLGSDVPSVEYKTDIRFRNWQMIPKGSEMGLTVYKPSKISSSPIQCAAGKQGLFESSAGSKLVVTYYIEAKSTYFGLVKNHEAKHVEYDLEHARDRDRFLMDGACLCKSCYNALRNYYLSCRNFIDKRMLYKNGLFDYVDYRKDSLTPMGRSLEVMVLHNNYSELVTDYFTLLKLRQNVLTACKLENFFPPLPPGQTFHHVQ